MRLAHDQDAGVTQVDAASPVHVLNGNRARTTTSATATMTSLTSTTHAPYARGCYGSARPLRTLNIHQTAHVIRLNLDKSPPDLFGKFSHSFFLLMLLLLLMSFSLSFLYTLWSRITLIL